MLKSICGYTLLLWTLLGGPKGCQAQLRDPVWWPLVQATHEGPSRLDRCNKRDGIRKPLGPPPNGQRCARRPKTCYFDTQFCDGNTPYPAIRCVCSGRTWQCGPASCPFNPSTPPPTEPPSNVPSTSSAPSSSPSSSGPMGSIAGNVKADTFNDDAGDLKLSGVPISLLDSSGMTIATTTTDESGNYVFYDLPIRSYEVVETNLAPFLFDVSDIDGGDPNRISVSIDPGSGLNSTDNDFVDKSSDSSSIVEPLGTISGLVLGFLGDRIPEVYLEGVPIILLDGSGGTVATTVTEASGYYMFYDLPLGSYEVVETNIATYPLDVEDFDGGDPNRISVTISLENGGVHSTHNIFLDKPLRFIAGQVLEDVNQDSLGDSPLPHVTVTVVDSSGEVVGTIPTDTNGRFTVQVPPGVYTLIETNLPNYRDVSDSDDGDPNMITVDVTSESSSNNTFTDEQLLRIDGQVMEDTNQDNCGDTPIPGVTVTVVDSSGNVIATLLTDNSGRFGVLEVPPGVYTLIQTNLPYYSDVTDLDGGDPNVITVDVTSASSSSSIFVDEISGSTAGPPHPTNFLTTSSPSFGDPLGSIAGTVMADTNNDDAGDLKLQGVPITLLGDTGVTVATTVTNFSGNYVFYDVPLLGEYEVVETNIAAYSLDVSDIDGGDPNKISVTIDPATGVSFGNDFVDEPLRIIAADVLEDKNGDGRGDFPIPGVIVTVVDIDSGDIVVTGLTDSNDGRFTVQVPPGVYTLIETNLINYSDVSDSDGGDPNLITVDVTTDSSTASIFVDEFS